MLLLITKVIVHKFFSQPYFLLLPFTNLLLLNNGTIKENKKHDFDNGVLTSFYAMLKKKNLQKSEVSFENGETCDSRCFKLKFDINLRINLYYIRNIL